ncbi:MAG: hypothetical protein CVU57_26430 [Deltaproteobacteria bacterium HGW-Deltaproteobacteria-15]|nr:MAG: hypothetical protein CVU57_26430 [Deltaproteobacteria bacterium HGW-Deltaproteobacteria-15]
MLLIDTLACFHLYSITEERICRLLILPPILPCISFIYRLLLYASASDNMGRAGQYTLDREGSVPLPEKETP